MLIDTVDPLDRPIGTAVRRDVLATKENFRVAHLFLFNSAGELLLQQLSPNRKRHPRAWGSSVASYLFSGETYEEAIVRRTAQELGRAISPAWLFGLTPMKDDSSEKFIGLYGAVDDGPFDEDRDHIARVEFLPVEKIERLMKKGEREFTPTFRHLFSFFRCLQPVR